MKKVMLQLLLAITVTAASNFQYSFGQTKPRARDLGIPFDGNPGPLDAVTDVKGVEVGVVGQFQLALRMAT